MHPTILSSTVLAMRTYHDETGQIYRIYNESELVESHIFAVVNSP